MTVGIQTFNSSGQLQLDTSHGISRVIGIITATAAGSGSVSLPSGYGSYWFHVAPSNGSQYSPVVSISGTTLSWNPATIFGPAVDCTIIYGVY